MNAHGRLLLAALTVMTVVLPTSAAAQAVSPAERDALVQLHVDRGGRSEDVERLLRRVDEASASGLPARPLASKIREGLAKGIAPGRIEAVVETMVADLATADRLIRELAGDATAGQRAAAVSLLGEALGGGVAAGDVRDLAQAMRTPAGQSAPAGALAAAAKGLSFIKDARLPTADGIGVVSESVRQGFRPYEVIDLGREIKRREQDYQSGRASLQALREAIARGDRPDRLWEQPVDRPDGASAPASRPPDRPDRVRPERPAERPVRPARPDVPERPARDR